MTGKLAVSGGRLVAKGGKLACGCCGTTPPTIHKICGCCFSDQSIVTVSNWPQIESDPDSGYTFEPIFSDMHNAFNGVFAWGTGPNPDYVGTWYALGEEFQDSYGYWFRWYFTIEVICDGDLISLAAFARLEEYYPEVGYMATNGAMAHVLEDNAWGTCCGDAWNAVYGLGSPFPPEWYFKLTSGSPTSGAITVSNNKACRCPDGNCVPTADGSDAICDETGINNCTAAQDDDCNPFP